MYSFLNGIKNIFTNIQRKYDMFIYGLAYHPIRRICERNPGYAYLTELCIKDWRKNHPISDSLKEATETFYEELVNYKKTKI